MDSQSRIPEPAHLRDVKVLLRGRTYSLTFAAAEDHILRTVRETGAFYESLLLAALKPFLSSSDLVLDVGANVGNHSVYFAGESDCSVLAFEPVAEAFTCLLANIDTNGLEFKIHPRNFALGAKAGRADIGTIDPENLGATRLEPDQAEGAVVVRTVDSLPEVQSDTVRLIKIDVEGMELSVLKGALRTVERDRPILVIECQADIDFDSIESFLSPMGYKAVECFNATPTYIFLHSESVGTVKYSLTDFLMEASLRSSRANQQLLSEINRLRRLISSEHRSIVDIREKIDSIPRDGATAD